MPLKTVSEKSLTERESLIQLVPLAVKTKQVPTAALLLQSQITNWMEILYHYVQEALSIFIQWVYK